MTISELKPCPFCWKNEQVESIIYHELNADSAEKVIRCDYCGACGPSCGNWAEAREDWNERK